MAKYVIDETTLSGLANALRGVTGEAQNYSTAEMIDKVTNILDSATYIMVDEDGNEVPAVYVDEELVLTATPNDIRIGTTAVTDNGVTEGEKEIPPYYVAEGRTRVAPGKELVINLYSHLAEYTRLQAVVCDYNTSMTNSVAATMVAINDKVYDVNSITEKASVIVDADKQSIKLGITNDSGSYLVVRYFTYKEMY